MIMNYKEIMKVRQKDYQEEKEENIQHLKNINNLIKITQKQHI